MKYHKKTPFPLPLFTKIVSKEPHQINNRNQMKKKKESKEVQFEILNFFLMIEFFWKPKKGSVIKTSPSKKKIEYSIKFK